MVVSCAAREPLSEPSYRAEGSRQEAPWLRLHLEKNNKYEVMELVIFDLLSLLFF